MTKITFSVVLTTLILLLTQTSAFILNSSSQNGCLRSTISKDQWYHPVLFAHSQGDIYQKRISRRRKIWKVSKKAFALLVLTASSFGTSPVSAVPIKHSTVIQTSKSDINRNQQFEEEDFDMYENGEHDEDFEIEENFDSFEEEKNTGQFRIGDDNYRIKDRRGRNTNVLQEKIVLIAIPVMALAATNELLTKKNEESTMKKAVKIQKLRRKKHEAEKKAKLEEEKAKLEAMKTNETSIDEEEDDSNVEDNEDNNITPPISPRKPNGDGNDGDNDGSDSGPPSAEDIDRLNKLMGK